jgi:type II secretory pathway pseudopilin PulG
MALCVVTINNLSPQLDKRFQEVQVVERALNLAQSAIRGAGGQQASGNIIDAGVTLGTWTYTAQASS